MTIDVQEIIRAVEQLPRAQQELVMQSIAKGLQGEDRFQSLTSIKRQHPGEWLAIIVPEGEDRYEPRRGRLIAHSSDRSKVWERVDALPSTENIYVFFNGPVAAKGFGMIFYDTDAPLATAESL